MVWTKIIVIEAGYYRLHKMGLELEPAIYQGYYRLLKMGLELEQGIITCPTNTINFVQTHPQTYSFYTRAT